MKKRPIHAHVGVTFRGRRLRRLPAMIFQWSWGRFKFDIRKVRQVLGHPAEHKEDTNFVDRSNAHDRIVDNLDQILGDRDFTEVLKKARAMPPDSF